MSKPDDNYPMKWEDIARINFSNLWPPFKSIQYDPVRAMLMATSAPIYSGRDRFTLLERSKYREGQPFKYMKPDRTISFT